MSTHCTDEVMVAVGFAAAAHMGQTDKAGQPYIDHPRRVARRLENPTVLELSVAWLHDVVEDTNLTVWHIEDMFGAEVAAAVDAITHRAGETRTDYYARVKANPVALKVKLADIADNTDPERLAALDPTTRARLQAKYANALIELGVGPRA